MSDNKPSNNNGKKNTSHSFEITCGVLGGLTLVFIVLKLFGVIGWRWRWVFSPLWISSLILFLYLFFGFIWTSLKR